MSRMVDGGVASLQGFSDPKSPNQLEALGNRLDDCATKARSLRTSPT